MKALLLKEFAEQGVPWLTAPLAFTDSGVWRASVYTGHAGLEKDWRRLETQGNCTVFQTYDWAACWYDVAAASGAAEPLIITVSQDNAGIIWLLPLCIYRKNGLKIISFPDFGYSNYAAPVIAPYAPSDPKAVRLIINMVFDALPQCDLVHFEKLAGTAGAAPNPLLHLPQIERYRVGSHGIELTEPWPEVKNKLMSARARSDIRRRKKKLHQEGRVEIQHHTVPLIKAAHLEELIAMQNQRFAEVGLPQMSDFGRKFYHALLSRKENSFTTCISNITVSGETIASSLGVMRGNSYLGIISAFATKKWHRFGPGIMLYDTLLEDFPKLTKAQSGYFDFSIGDNAYKRSFGCHERPLYEYMKPCSLKGRAAFALWQIKLFLRRHPKTFEWLRRWRSENMLALKRKITAITSLRASR